MHHEGQLGTLITNHKNGTPCSYTTKSCEIGSVKGRDGTMHIIYVGTDWERHKDQLELNLHPTRTGNDGKKR